VSKDSLLSTILGYYGYSRDRVTAASASLDDRFSQGESVDVAMSSKQWDRTSDTGNIARINKDMWIAYKTNPLIYFVTELTVRMIIGNETKLVANGLEDDDNPQERAAAELLQSVALDPFWSSPENNWPSLLPDVARDIVLFGEAFPIPNVNTMIGDVIMGFVPPEAIKKMRRDALNSRRVTHIVIMGDNNQEIELPIVSIDKPGLATMGTSTSEVYGSAANSTAGRLTGRCFYWAINRALTSARGSGDYVQAIRPARDAVKVVKSIAERTELNNRIVMDITFPSSENQESINAMMKPGSTTYINPPKLTDVGPKLFAHSENIKLSMIAPNIGASESTETFKMLKAMFCAATAFPEHWIFGQGENANKASASEMGAPAYGYLNARQTSLKGFVREVVQFAIDQKRIFTNQLDGLTDEQCKSWDIVMPAVDTEDESRLADIAGKKVNTIMAAMMNGLDAEQARSLVRDVLVNDLGMKVPEITAMKRPVITDAEATTD
jgi:hypothetical protein